MPQCWMQIQYINLTAEYNDVKKCIKDLEWGSEVRGGEGSNWNLKW